MEVLLSNTCEHLPITTRLLLSMQTSVSDNQRFDWL